MDVADRQFEQFLIALQDVENLSVSKDRERELHKIEERVAIMLIHLRQIRREVDRRGHASPQRTLRLT